MKSDDTRRGFLRKGGAIAFGGAAALLTGSDDVEAKVSWAEWFQGNYRLMSDSERRESIVRLEERYTEEHGTGVSVSGSDSAPGVLFGYALNVKSCIGCRRCAKGCVSENNQSRENTSIEWIRVIEMKKGNFTTEKTAHGVGGKEGSGYKVGGHAGDPVGVTLEGEHYYDPDLVPEDENLYMPVACMQCDNPPCVKVCPVQATYREPDGIVVIDYNWCIGCRMCMSACPYWARRFNWGTPNLPKDELNPKTHYLGNRPRSAGVVEKCTFCIQRVREGRYPACVEVCPVGARKFGNLLDPESEVRKVLETKKVFRLKAELNTDPKFFYYMD